MTLVRKSDQPLKPPPGLGDVARQVTDPSTTQRVTTRFVQTLKDLGASPEVVESVRTKDPAPKKK